MMDFQTAVRTCLQQKYATISGRAQRSELWWFWLFGVGVSAMLSLVDSALFGSGASVLAAIWSLAILLPSICVGGRRLHDRDMSAWWLLIAFVPVVGAIGLLVLYCLPGTEGPNQFGPDPLGQRAS